MPDNLTIAIGSPIGHPTLTGHTMIAKESVTSLVAHTEREDGNRVRWFETTRKTIYPLIPEKLP